MTLPLRRQSQQRSADGSTTPTSGKKGKIPDQCRVSLDFADVSPDEMGSSCSAWATVERKYR
jgi:hypothetical protein